MKNVKDNNNKKKTEYWDIENKFNKQEWYSTFMDLKISWCKDINSLQISL